MPTRVLQGLASDNNAVRGASPVSTWRARLPVAVAVVAGVLLSATASTLIWQWETKQSKQELAAAAQSHFLALQRGLDEYLGSLRALKALFEVSDRVTRAQFETFAASLLADKKGVQNFSWIPYVPRTDRRTFEAEAARDGLSDYQVRAVTTDNKIIPSPERDEYLPILFSTVPRSSRIYGIDLLSQFVIRTRLERARDENSLSAVPDFILHSKEGDVRGFLFSLPVYRRGQSAGTTADRRSNLLGFTHGAFLTAEAIEHILDANTTPRGLDLSIFLPGAAPDSEPIYVHRSRLRTTPAEPRSLAALQAGQYEISSLSTSSTSWTLVATAIENGPLRSDHFRAWSALLAGWLITAGVAKYLDASIQHRLLLIEANNEISNLARRDPLTSLYNRRAFSEFLTTSFAMSKRNDRPFAVLILDLDHFKEINDTLGHPVGDALLQQVSQRVLKACRQTDILARLGGDEFAILIPELEVQDAVTSLARRINDVLRKPYNIAGRSVSVTASVGAAEYSEQLDSIEALLVRADEALYRAKREGRGGFRVWMDSKSTALPSCISFADA